MPFDASFDSEVQTFIRQEFFPTIIKKNTPQFAGQSPDKT